MTNLGLTDEEKKILHDDNAIKWAMLVVIGTNDFVAVDTSGVYCSIDRDDSRHSVNTGWSNRNIQALAVMGTNLFAGTFYRGVRRWSLSMMIVTGIENKEINCPVLFSLVR